jgi:hypothetical protein
MALNGTANGIFTARQEAVALALAAGATIPAAAARARCGARTVKRWLTEHPGFRRHVDELRAEMVGRALGTLADAMTEAAAVLRQLLAAKSDTVRLGACRSILELTTKLKETTDLEQRLSALEQQLEEK